MFSIETKLAYDEWHKHAEQYNKLLQAGFEQINNDGGWCNYCADEAKHLYRKPHAVLRLCFNCAKATLK